MDQTFPETFAAETFLHRVREETQVWIREAAVDGSLSQRMDAVSQAVRAKYGDEPGGYTWPRDVFDDFVIVSKGDALWRVSYTLSADGAVSIGDDLQKVKQTYVDVSEAYRESLVYGPLNDDGSMFVVREGAERPSGKKWGVFIIQEGLSLNRNNYRREALIDAAPLYENRPVYLGHYYPEEGQSQVRPNAESGKVGFLKDVKPVYQGVKEGTGGRLALAGTLVVTKRELREEMLDAWDEGHEQYGLSHDAYTEATVAVDVASGKPFYDVTRIKKVESVDLVTNPAAGGRLLRLVAGNVEAATLERDWKMLEKMIEKIRQSGNAALIRKLEALGTQPGEDGVWTIYDELLRSTATPPVTEAQRLEAARQAEVEAAATRQREEAARAAAAAAGTADQTETRRRLEETERALLDVSRGGRRSFLEASVRGTTLPDAARTFVQEMFLPRITAATSLNGLPTEAEVTEAIRRQVEMFGRLAEGGIIVPSSRADIRMGDSQLDKINKGLDAFFGVQTTEETKPDGTKVKKYKPIAPDNHRSFREIYVTITGDTQVTGRRSEATRLTEALSSTSFDQILADSITRRMVADYQNSVDLNTWRLIADVVSVSDFRTQRRMRFGGYGNLSTVAERAPYPALTSPTDEEVTYSPSKRGGTESISIEMIKNDDVGVVRRIPTKLARAAAQTLYEFVWDFLRLNPTIYDSVALAASGHNNLTTSALSQSQLSASRLLLMKQTDMNNGKRLALTPTYLIVPMDLQELATQLTTSTIMLPDTSLATTAAAAAPNFLQRQGIQPIVVNYWTDANDWWLTADKAQAPMVEIGFMDGREDPEIFVSDIPNAGSLFTNDVITWKLRHTYGGNILDYRPFVGAVVP